MLIVGWPLIVNRVPEIEGHHWKAAISSWALAAGARGRFLLVFLRFASVFARPHPVILFLDHLQWAAGHVGFDGRFANKVM